MSEPQGATALPDAMRGKFNNIVSGYRINADDAQWLYSALTERAGVTAQPALTDEQAIALALENSAGTAMLPTQRAAAINRGREAYARMLLAAPVEAAAPPAKVVKVTHVGRHGVSHEYRTVEAAAPASTPEPLERWPVMPHDDYHQWSADSRRAAATRAETQRSSHTAGSDDPTTRALRDALDRVTNNFRLLLAGKPVRDVDETLAECDSALSGRKP
jgi:hypothetical protein